MKKLLVFCLIFSLAAGAAYWYWTGTPQYSVMKLAEAVRNHDLNTFHTYCDVSRLSEHAVDDLSAEPLQAIGGRGLLQRFLGIAVTRLFKPELASMLAKNITDYVEKNPAQESLKTPKSEIPVREPRMETAKEESFLGKAMNGLAKVVKETFKPPSLKEVLRELGLSKENFKGMSDYQMNGSRCLVGIKFQEPGKREVLVQLELENTDRHWRLVRFSNLDEIARSVSGI